MVTSAQIMSSHGIVTVPIYDDTQAERLRSSQPPVTIVGFLQVFINGVDTTNGKIQM